MIRREDEHVLAPDPIPEVPEDYAPDGPRREPDPVGPESEQRPDERLAPREEELAEDQRRRRAIEEEVVPLNGGPDEARQDHLTNGRRISPALSAHTLQNLLLSMPGPI